jgi:hypothetical protein
LRISSAGRPLTGFAQSFRLPGLQLLEQAVELDPIDTIEKANEAAHDAM